MITQLIKRLIGVIVCNNNQVTKRCKMKQERKESVSVRLAPRVREELMIAAIKQRRRMSDLVNEACESYLANQKALL
jgi:hypothetical protein